MHLNLTFHHSNMTHGTHTGPQVFSFPMLHGCKSEWECLLNIHPPPAPESATTKQNQHEVEGRHEVIFSWIVLITNNRATLPNDWMRLHFSIAVYEVDSSIGKLASMMSRVAISFKWNDIPWTNVTKRSVNKTLIQQLGCEHDFWLGRVRSILTGGGGEYDNSHDARLLQTSSNYDFSYCYWFRDSVMRLW